MLKVHTFAHCCKIMLLALLKRTVLEIVFCFTYCKMNQRFILWRLLFCWYTQYDRYIYIEYVCYLYLMQYVNLMARMISGWLFTFCRKTRASRHMKATSLPVQTGKAKQQHRLPAGGDFASFPVSCCSFKCSPTPMIIWKSDKLEANYRIFYKLKSFFGLERV